MSHFGYICSIPSANIVPSADGPSADGTVPSGYILPNLQTGRQQMGHPICQHFAQSTDILPNLPTSFESCVAHQWIFVL